MKKKSVSFPRVGKYVELDLADNKIEVEVIQYLSIGLQEQLIGIYVDAYFNASRFESGTDFFGAESILDLAILDVATSVNIDLKKFDMDEIYQAGLMYLIKDKIINYRDFKFKLDRVVLDKQKEMFSTKGILKQITSSVENMDFDNIRENLSKLQEELGDSPLKSLFDESKKG